MNSSSHPKLSKGVAPPCPVKVVGNDLAGAHPWRIRRLRGASVSRGIGRLVETFFIDNSTLLHIHTMDPFAFAISPLVGVETKQSSGTPNRTSGPIPKTEEARFVVFAILCMPGHYDPRLCRYTFKFCSLFEEDGACRTCHPGTYLPLLKPVPVAVQFTKNEKRHIITQRQRRQPDHKRSRIFTTIKDASFVSFLLDCNLFNCSWIIGCNIICGRVG